MNMKYIVDSLALLALVIPYDVRTLEAKVKTQCAV